MTLPFPDVSEASWYANDVCFAWSEQLVSGYPDGTFRPDRAVTFAEAAKVLALTFELEAHPQLAVPWYRPYVDALAEARAIPTSIRSFDQPVTRGEVAEMAARLLRRDSSKPSQTYDGLVR